MALAHPWGVLRAEFDASALTLFRLDAYPADRAFRRRNAD
ncbi:hypothetical protein ACLFLT_25165 [Klebsiella pneumoniae]